MTLASIETPHLSLRFDADPESVPAMLNYIGR
jgi:hypothetical protein